MSEEKKVETPKAETPKTEPPKAYTQKVDVAAWKRRKMKAINLMKNRAKAQELAEIVRRVK